MPIDWSPLTAFVRRHQRFLITTHVRPDADGLGSMLALAEAIETLGKSVRCVIASPMPPQYAFLDPTKSIEVFNPPGEQNCDALIVLDTGTWNQLADMAAFVRASPAEKVVIDHHRTQDDLAAKSFVDITAEATGRLVHDAITALGVPLTPCMARNLFAALATDTGWFRHPNATQATFDLAGHLVGAGAEPTPLHENLYERNSLQSLRFRGRVLERLTTRVDGRIAFSWVQFTDYAETGAIPLDTENLVNYPRSITGVEIGLLFIEQRDGSVKVSFRSRRADVARLAEQFAGGGHKLASGATVPGPLDTARERVLAAAVTAVDAL